MSSGITIAIDWIRVCVCVCWGDLNTCIVLEDFHIRDSHQGGLHWKNQWIRAFPSARGKPWSWSCCVVISQTHWLVSQERLSPRAGTSVFIEYTVVPSGGSGSISQLVCHTTLLPYQGALASTANFKYSEYFYNN